MEIGETASLTAMVNPAEASNKDVTWSTASDAIATVDDNGLVTAISDGVTEITVTSVADPTISAICKVTVKKGIVPVTGISLNEHSKELEEGDNFTLIATITPEDATDKTVTWTTSNPAVATVTDNGVVTAVTAGTATILATASNGAFDQCEITVVRGDVDVERISLSNTELTLTEGEETDLLAIVLPADATDKHVRWSLHDDSIINLDPVTEEDADGNVITNKALIKALKAGETNIIVTSVSNPKATAMCKVTVKAVYIPVTTVTLDPTEKTIEEGESFTITPTVEPENATEPALTWSSSAEAIATVSENGEVTGVTPGSAIIYATASNGVYGQCVVTVVRGDVDVERISLSNTELTLTEGEETDLLAIVLPADATDKHVTWSVPDETVINLTPATEEDADGNVITNRSLIKALTAGETIITVTSVSNPKATAVCKVTVKSAYIPVTKVTLDPSEKTIEEGETFIITPNVEPENATEPGLTWSSSAEAVATVSDNGEVTGITPGTATIYATASNGSYGQCVVTVVRGEVNVERISLSNTELYLTEGEETDIFAIVLPTDATDKRVTWSLADDDIISLAEPLEDEIESAAPSKCYIKALKAGETTITVTSVSNPEVTAECKVTVSPLFIAVEGITLNEHYKEVLEGTIFTLVATVTPENATNKEVTWSTSAESIAVVSDSGEVTALSTGTATIYATTSNGLYDSCEVTVVKGEVPVIGLALTSYELFLTEGEVTDLDAFIRPSDATDQRVTWSIDQSSVASVVDASYVNENGSRVNTSIVTAGVAGEAIITVTSVANPEVYAECKVTVTPAFMAVEGIELNRTSLVMTEGETFDLIAIITPENATDSSVAWVSSNVDVATVSDTGVVTASKAGNSVIHATASNGLFATCDVTVLPRTIEVESIYVEPSELIIWQGEEAVLKAIVLPEDATDKTITWTSNAPDIVSVEDGVVLGLQEGIATVMAKSVNGKTAFCAVKVKGRPLTPKQLLRKGDGTTSTFVIMMPISDAELAENGYNFVTGYTDKEGVSSIIADTPLRYSHTTPEIYNNPEYDFWAFAYVRSESGEVINSNLRHLDGREEVCVDASVYGFNTKGGSVKGAEDWITVMPKKVRIEASSNNEMEISIFTLTGLQVYERSFTGNNRVVEEIELSQFVAGPYVVTVKCDGEEKSKKIVVR